MCKAEKELQEEVKRLLKLAEEVDGAEDKQYGRGKQGDELPAELRRRESRLKKIGEAKAALEEEARERAAKEAEQAQRKIEQRRFKEHQTGQRARGREPEVADPEKAQPEPKAQPLAKSRSANALTIPLRTRFPCGQFVRGKDLKTRPRKSSTSTPASRW